MARIIKNKYCECNCGQEIKIQKHHKYYGIPKYILGHHAKINNPMQGKKRPDTSEYNRKYKPEQMKGKNNPHYKEPIKIICKTCNKDFFVKPCFRSRKYCSHNCFIKNPETIMNLKKINSKTFEERFGEDKANKIKTKLRNIMLKRVKEQGGFNIGKNEKKILDNFENKIGYKIDRKFNIIGYKPDGYIHELNIVIEVDESYHNNSYYKKKDVIRQKRIENELNCQFIRIKDNG